MSKSFKDLTEQEILALAATSEEEDSRIYGDIADGLKTDFPASAKLFQEMQLEEKDHCRRLAELYKQRFGDNILLIRRQDVKGFIHRKPLWLVRPLGINTVRKMAESMELETRLFYERAAEKVTDISTRQLLNDLAEAERKHHDLAEALGEKLVNSTYCEKDDHREDDWQPFGHRVEFH